MAQWQLDNPHPEITWRTLFGKVWYEGYSQPEYVWQSTGGTDDFEAKFSLTPLIYGTLKGTFYALLIAVPLALLAAVYVSEFMHPDLKAYVKPVVEIMAALPSVVLGFLAGLWLAPLVERIVPGLFLIPLVLPVVIVLALLAWQLVPIGVRGRVKAGSEVFLLIPVVVVGVWLALVLGGLVERLLLGGNYRGWLLSALGLTYDQRNSLVVGIAMGFAVIPIIFTIAEDSLANVPGHLRAGSLALGANRWQTALRIVLPTASPGIFSAIMIGFGRAVGETMIVLMATGNTPVMDWSIFNGFRALSANIAVELPEAPEQGTLFRVLFLAALLLFCLTFVAEHGRRAGAPQAPEEVPVPMRKLWRSGEPFIWLTGGALALSLLLVAGLIGLILYNGLGFFWPKDVLRVDPPRRQGHDRAARRPRARPRASRASTGSSSRWPTATSTAPTSSGSTRARSPRREYPADVVVIERTEWGALIGTIKEVRRGDQVVASGPQAGWAEVEKRLPDASRVRAEIRGIEKGEIGRINYAQEQIRLKLRRLELRGVTSGPEVTGAPAGARHAAGALPGPGSAPGRAAHGGRRRRWSSRRTTARRRRCPSPRSSTPTSRTRWDSAPRWRTTRRRPGSSSPTIPARRTPRAACSRRSSARS